MIRLKRVLIFYALLIGSLLLLGVLVKGYRAAGKVPPPSAHEH